jgi:hypothetical protein
LATASITIRAVKASRVMLRSDTIGYLRSELRYSRTTKANQDHCRPLNRYC